ncbi:MAG TPA: hypothetical protein PKK06_13615 [Phycisphaerae bacterium]|nr:hypothetical protein [Phycisphaerae bacterium]HNU46123.1 hypothetical protein [Phycisphaerae bacterium]
MKEPQHNPNDPLFLLSCSLDGELTPQEQQRLAEALARSPQLRAEGEQLGRVDHLVRAWGECDTNVDADALTAEVRAFLADEAAEAGDQTVQKESSRVDQLLHRWAAPQVAFDEARFAAGVLRRLVQEQRLRMVRRWVIRLGTPLAAAAVIALAFISRVGPVAVPEPAPGPRAVVHVQVGPQALAGGAASPAVCQVRFAREAATADSLTPLRRGVSYAWAGPAPAVPRADAPLPW